MQENPRRRPRDANQYGKLVVDIATGQVEDVDTTRQPDALRRAADQKGRGPRPGPYVRRTLTYCQRGCFRAVGRKPRMKFRCMLKQLRYERLPGSHDPAGEHWLSPDGDPEFFPYRRHGNPNAFDQAPVTAFLQSLPFERVMQARLLC